MADQRCRILQRPNDRRHDLSNRLPPATKSWNGQLMNLHRVTPLPVGPARGRLIVGDEVVKVTQRALRSASEGGARESMAWWLGSVVGVESVVLSVVRPKTVATAQSVMASAEESGWAARLARRYGLGIVAQLHTHPGTVTRHSDGDDRLILMPFEGMFSIVLAEYGHGELSVLADRSIHQYQNGRWVLIDPDVDVMVTVPPLVLP